MSVTYCTASQVGEFLGLGSNYFSNSTEPSESQVEDLINNAEDHIDQETQHAWREVTVGNAANNEYEWHDVKHPHRWETGRAVYLNNRKIRSLDSAQGDVLEVWDGDEYVDYLGTKTEARNNGDYWLDYDQGILYIRKYSLWPSKKAVRVVYRFGENSVPNDIREAAIKLAAADIVENDDFSINIPDGTDNVPLEQKSSKWRRRVKSLLQSRSEVQAVSIA